MELERIGPAEDPSKDEGTGRSWQKGIYLGDHLLPATTMDELFLMRR